VPPRPPSILAQHGHNELRSSSEPKPGFADARADTGGLEPFIRPMLARDWSDVATIYEEGIRTRMATFETVVPEWEEWDRSHLKAHRLVAEQHREIVGWAALGPASGRGVYAGVTENSVYVTARAQRQGIGRALLDALTRGADLDGIWTIQAGIFPENRASLALHRACGFRVVGVRERIGRLDGTWRDVVLLERRSAVVL
jgi:L-amino acid N-acyltransferase YncA